MGKKVYHIVDPETGEVVGKKRVGRIGQAYYKTSPKGRALFILSLIPGFLMVASAIVGFFAFFASNLISDSLLTFLFYVLVINAALSIVLIFLWSILDEHRVKKDAEIEGGKRE